MLLLAAGKGKTASDGALNAVAGIRINDLALEDHFGVELNHGVQATKWSSTRFSPIPAFAQNFVFSSASGASKNPAKRAGQN